MGGQRLVNDHSFVCSELSGKKVESMVGYYEGDNSDRIDMLVLKVEGKGLYQRFFLDAGMGFWEEWSREDATEGYNDCQAIDLSIRYSLSGKSVVIIECKGDCEKLSSIMFDIECSQLIYHYIDKSGPESATELRSL